MEHPFPYADDNKRYHTLAYHLKKRFGRRVFKASIDAGFTCPNLDGTRGTGGCTYCQGGSGAFAPGPSLSVSDQVRQEQARIHSKWKDAPVIAYFQAHTNTYAPLPVLREKFEQALEQGSQEEVVIHEFCDRMQIPFEKISSEDFSAFLRILSLSKMLKNPNNMRGKAKPQPYYAPKRKKRR